VGVLADVEEGIERVSENAAGHATAARTIAASHPVDPAWYRRERGGAFVS
jgi:hypothetical protein